jgi:hypothetical protein
MEAHPNPSQGDNAPAKGQGKHQLMTWHPREIEPPVVQPALHRMGAVERSAEVIRYAVFTTEYWVSPRGGLREWLRLNLWFALVLAVPALLITPIASYMLAELAAGSGQLADIAKNLSQIPAAIRDGALVVAGMGAIMAFKFLFR